MEASISHVPNPAQNETQSIIIVLTFIQVMSKRRLEIPQTEKFGYYGPLSPIGGASNGNGSKSL